MPIEIMAARGVDTIRFGPMKPVGLTDPARAKDLSPCCNCARKTPKAAFSILWAFRLI